MNATAPAKILHVITDLGMGGAEMVLYRLLSRLDRSFFNSEVISLTDDQPVGGMIRTLGIPVTALGFRPGVPDPRMVNCLSKIIRDRQPHLLQTWMYHADLSGGLAAHFAGSPPVVWGIHHTVAERTALKPATYAVARLNAILSYSLPKKIVCCAQAARASHIRLGYAAAKMDVIPNGFDTELFRPDPSARREVRRELGLSDETPLVGLCARFHPDKDHRNFFNAARLVSKEIPEVHFILWGKGIDEQNEILQRWNQDDGLGNVIHMLGQRSDSNRLFAALDVAALSSSTEAFPAVVGEAMACGVPCVSTDTGDSRAIIADTGIVVPRRNPEALAKGLLELLFQPERRHQMGEYARRRIREEFSLEKMASAYVDLYRDIIGRRK